MKKILYSLLIFTSLFMFSNVNAAEMVCEDLICVYNCESNTIVLKYDYKGISSILPKVYEGNIKDGVLNYNTNSSGIIAKGLSVSNNGNTNNACTCPNSISFDGTMAETGSDCKQTSYSSIDADDNKVTNGTSYEKIECGDVKIPYLIPKTISVVITLLQIATPIIIIVVGSLDLVKAVMAQKDDEIKKGQQTFLKRLMVGAVVFLVFVIVKVLLGVVAPRDGDYTNMWSCIDCFVTGECDSVKVN